MTPAPHEMNKTINGTHPPHQWREVCCLRHTATGHVEPPVTHQEVLVEQRSIWAQHGFSAALTSAHVKHLQKGHIGITVVPSEG